VFSYVEAIYTELNMVLIVYKCVNLTSFHKSNQNILARYVMDWVYYLTFTIFYKFQFINVDKFARCYSHTPWHNCRDMVCTFVPSEKPASFVPVYAAVSVPLSTSRWPHTCTPNQHVILQVVIASELFLKKGLYTYCKNSF